MSEEIKFEPVFGDQSLFDSAPEDVDMIGYNGGFYKNSKDGPMYCCGCTFTTDEYRNKGFIAMRRIIKEPTWTKADQEKGILPTVGCELRIGSDLYIVEAINSNEGQLCVRDKSDGELSITYRQYIKPIETPREKYDRERDECIDKLLERIPSYQITIVPAMKIVYEEIRPFTGDDRD